MVRARLVAASLALLVVGAPSVAAQEPEPEGRELYVESCLSCHGADGAGTDFGPPIGDAGEAAVDFQLRTGRMPLADPDDQTMRKPPAFSPQEIDALVDYVGSLGGGPPIPNVVPAAGDLVVGQELFVHNCAACHGATGNGGAAGVGALAPSLYASKSLDIAEAVITGPGEMPVFDFEQEEINAIARYIDFLQKQDAPGGADIGGVGPVPEGFVGWTVGMLTLGAICWLIGSRARPRREP